MSISDTTNAPDCLARAPGKLILSGEHSVVYGAPALAIAIEQYTSAWFTPIHRSAGLRTAFQDLSSGHFYPFEMLRGLKHGLDQRFEAFARGELQVQQILHRPDDLAVYSVASLLQNLPLPGSTKTHKIPTPGKLSTRSELLLGAGMGSSAAVIAATMVLYEHLLDAPQSLDERFDKVRFCERLQHGKGSAIDAACVIRGGAQWSASGQVKHIPTPDLSGWYWVLHGVPEASTGECVARVRRDFGDDTALWDAFTTCTHNLRSALEACRPAADIITENHDLLSRIGIVPEPAQRFVRAVQSHGGAAKVSGAGAVRGSKAGVVLVYMPDPDAMTALMGQYPDCRWAPIKVSARGAELINGGGNDG